MGRRMTYDEYAQLEESERRYELVDGILEAMSPGPNTRHQRILRNLSGFFFGNCMQAGEFFFAPLDVIFSPHDVRQPDFVFVSKERLAIVTERGIEGAPDLLVEILSPSTAKTDKASKRQSYEQFGVREYWLVDPYYEMVEQLILENGKYVLTQTYGTGDRITSPYLPCISIPTEFLFN